MTVEWEHYLASILEKKNMIPTFGYRRACEIGYIASFAAASIAIINQQKEDSNKDDKE